LNCWSLCDSQSRYLDDDPGAQVAQSVEQRTENPRVGGSIPSLGNLLSRCLSTVFLFLVLSFSSLSFSSLSFSSFFSRSCLSPCFSIYFPPCFLSGFFLLFCIRFSFLSVLSPKLLVYVACYLLQANTRLLPAFRYLNFYPDLRGLSCM